MKTNRQGLHAPDSLALPNYIPAAASRANKEFIQRLDGNEDAAVFNFGAGRAVTLGYSKNLMQ